MGGLNHRWLPLQEFFLHDSALSFLCAPLWPITESYRELHRLRGRGGGRQDWKL